MQPEPFSETEQNSTQLPLHKGVDFVQFERDFYHAYKDFVSTFLLREIWKWNDKSAVIRL